MNTKLFLATVITAIITTSLAHAAPTTNKSSFYAGLNLGYGSMRANEKVTVSGVAGPLGRQTNGATKSRLAADGIIITLTGGYNYINNNFSMGPELEIGYTDVSDSTTGNRTQGIRKLQAKESLGVYGRLGYNFNTTFIYTKFGIKNQNIKYHTAAFIPVASGKTNHRKNGLAIGGGVECPINDIIGFRAEFMHTRFAKSKISLKTPNAALNDRVSYSIKPTSNSGTVGVFIKI